MGTGAQSSYSFIPVRLVGETCGAEVAWRTEWTPLDLSGSPPVFFGMGQVGVVGYRTTLDWGSWVLSRQPGILRIWAAVDGAEYGPVTITFTGGGYY